ncbi:MAG: radical SAM protein [Promethearchaeota archaeon]|jgi:wyosine [tRNA(Phe)-imidazoG37] synthetase (radical SAM superfamily)
MKNEFIIDDRITAKFVETYTKSTYRIVGDNKHSSIKPCHWLEQRLMTGRENRNCYKGVFGVKSHKCLQNTPSLPFCNHQCVFCWRDIEVGSLGSEFKVTPDEPKDIVREMLRHHRDIIKNHLPLRRYLDNYEIMLDVLYYMLLNKETSHNLNSLMNGIHVSKNKIERAINLLKNQNFVKPKNHGFNDFELDDDIRCCINSREEIEVLVNRALTSPDDIMQTHSEAMIPNHAAISLDGEPLLYPRMSDFVQEFKNRSMSTFIVTNGTLPERIKVLDPLPSQLYITLPAPNERIYKQVCRPMIKNGWDKINESLELVNSLSCRTLVRLTAVKNLNIDEQYLKDYQEIIKNTNPNFFEIKGFTLQAKALSIKERLKSEESLQYFFPEYKYLEDLALKFQEMSGFPLIYKNQASRDFLFAVNWDKDKDPKITNL